MLLAACMLVYIREAISILDVRCSIASFALLFGVPSRILDCRVRVRACVYLPIVGFVSFPIPFVRLARRHVPRNRVGFPKAPSHPIPRSVGHRAT